MMKNKLNILGLLSLTFIGACSTSSGSKQTPKSNGPVSTWRPGVENVPQIEAQDLGVDPSHIIPEEDKSEPVPKPVVGIIVEGVALDSMVALGFMQELAKAGVIPEKVMGLGWGCWIALSWAFEASSNQAEWQAFKWSSWKFLGIENKGFLSRFTGNKSSYDNYLKEMKVWLTKSEFKDYAMDVDCPLLKPTRHEADLKSASSQGVYKALWEQIQIPLLGANFSEEKQNSEWLSGIASQNITLEEYDSFSKLKKTAKSVDFWIHLQASSPELKSAGDLWLSSTFKRAQGSSSNWLKTPQDRWVVKIPIHQKIDMDPKKSLDFSQRRSLLLKGRELGRDWIESQWFQNHLAPALAN